MRREEYLSKLESGGDPEDNDFEEEEDDDPKEDEEDDPDEDEEDEEDDDDEEDTENIIQKLTTDADGRGSGTERLPENVPFRSFPRFRDRRSSAQP